MVPDTYAMVTGVMRETAEDGGKELRGLSVVSWCAMLGAEAPDCAGACCVEVSTNSL